MSVQVGIIGGSGFYEMPGFRAAESQVVDTPFGAPSAEVVTGDLEGTAVAFIPRHGSGHRLSPSEVPYRANIYALKTMGAHTVLSVNAVGSLHLAYAPGHLAVPDDLFDRTRARASSFFGSGVVAHVGLAQPFCAGVRAALVAAQGSVQTTVHDGGAMMVVEGPRFSTVAESVLYRSWAFRLIGMTAMPEAALAREAEMCYASVSVITDYDVWHTSEEAVSADAVLETMRRTVDQAQVLVRAAMPAIRDRDDCTCRHALAPAMATARQAMDAGTLARLGPLVGRQPAHEM